MSCRPPVGAGGTTTPISSRGSTGMRGGAVIEHEHDGFAVDVLTGGARAEFELPATDSAVGRYCCVLKGNVSLRGSAFGPLSLGWSKPGSPAIEARAGDEGCVLLLLAFPTSGPVSPRPTSA